MTSSSGDSFWHTALLRCIRQVFSRPRSKQRATACVLHSVAKEAKSPVIFARAVSFELSLRLTSRCSTNLVCDYGLCGLLRDNVQHHLEKPLGAGRYALLHDLVDAVWEGSLSISAGRFRGEVARAWAGLAELPICGLAVGSRTHAALSGDSEPLHNSTFLLRYSDWAVPSRLDEYETLGQLFGPLTRRLLSFCDSVGVDAIDCRLLCYPSR